ncbi:PSD1 and planctomycete cytochrome C domain-containing protein [Stieleria sp. TO1_6]|uniref:PSD1 and planctomycete cytochrome C domain-containing protein n=1 Tax=Stieleria tagensis TaxID=2956795 RepID=UPI00209AE948|nr:PSD1 and planctomycete cytochrome C domain-containing protein [Stieleria tagensis]MCO8123959.1 PSD1 and planctomycete cytochrome C domain-containing protein [Stieleria tagensis]
MLRCLPSLFLSVLVFVIVTIACQHHLLADENEYFERKIRPLLSEHCYSCHSSNAKTVHGGLLLDSSAGIVRGGDSGAVLHAGKPTESLLIETIAYDGEIQMPPKGKLSDRDIAELTRWVQQGAHYPDSLGQLTPVSGEINFEKAKEFWSFQPLRKQLLPEIENNRWPQVRLDHFVLASMERERLTPSPPADRATLIRRLCFDLIGMPPTPEQIRDFVADDSPNAYERLVDSLLESPQYGEHWARWWLDMARYTDRTASWLYQAGQPYLYRDWVVDALNQDMAYDDFIRRQLATDLMRETGPEDLSALGFVSLSPTYWKELKLPCEIINVIVADEWEERVDAVSRTFLGLTVACARCHDHKFDPISSEDYYAMAGIFASCRQIERPLVSEERYEPVRIAKIEVARFEAEIAKLKKQNPQPKSKLAELAAEIKDIQATTALYDTPLAPALSEESMFVVRAGKTPQEGTRIEYRAEPRDLPAYIRGNPNRPGPIVPRRFLSVLSDNPQPYRNGSGRLELANSLTTDAAPLTARVIVNRIWLAHFGQGIVSTPSNFGNQGSRPTHPQLLDDLAARFVAGGWSIKRLHREILLSATWQQSSAESEHASADPDNIWLSRMNRRRITFEQWRDAMLVASDFLDLSLGGASTNVDDNHNHRRTLYATVHRRDMSATLMVHDFPDPTQHSPQRVPTVTALQGLYALNGPLLLRQSQAVVSRLTKDAPNDGDRGRITRTYWWLFSREPTENEMEMARAFLGTASESDQLRWQQYVHVLLACNEFLFVD